MHRVALDVDQLSPNKGAQRPNAARYPSLIVLDGNLFMG